MALFCIITFGILMFILILGILLAMFGGDVIDGPNPIGCLIIIVTLILMLCMGVFVVFIGLVKLAT